MRWEGGTEISRMVRLTLPVRLLGRQDLEDIDTSPAMGRLKDDLWGYPDFFSHASDMLLAGCQVAQNIETALGFDLRVPVLHNRIC